MHVVKGAAEESSALIGTAGLRGRAPVRLLSIDLHARVLAPALLAEVLMVSTNLDPEVLPLSL